MVDYCIGIQMNILILHIKKIFPLQPQFFWMEEKNIKHFHGPIKVLWALGTGPPVSLTAQNKLRTNPPRKLVTWSSENLDPKHIISLTHHHISMYWSSEDTIFMKIICKLFSCLAMKTGSQLSTDFWMLANAKLGRILGLTLLKYYHAV